MTNENSQSDPFEMFRRLWGPLGLPVPGMAMPTLDPHEVEKRIADLRSVEGWLSMNLNMVRLSIQGLEVQKSALLAVRSAAGADAQAPQSSQSGSAGGASEAGAAMLWPWMFVQRGSPASPSQEGGEAGPAAETDKQ